MLELLLKPTDHIAFEGAIAAGKTTAAKMLATRVSPSTLVLERFTENEFLADFYADNTRHALPMQLSFMVDRHAQLRIASLPAHNPIVADYSYAKDGLFAELLLTDRELRLYRRVDESISGQLAKPTQIVFLEATVSTLLERIGRRTRPYERSIDGQYLRQLIEAYERQIANSSTRVLRINTEDIDVRTTEGADSLVRLIAIKMSRGIVTTQVSERAP